MNASFNQWQKTFLGLVNDLNSIFEEELQSLLLPKVAVFNEIQERKNALLHTYEKCILEGKTYEALLKAVSQEQRELWIKEIDEVHFLAERNAKITQQFIQEIQQSFSAFHAWLRRPSLKGSYSLNNNLSLGLDRRM